MNHDADEPAAGALSTISSSRRKPTRRDGAVLVFDLAA